MEKLKFILPIALLLLTLNSCIIDNRKNYDVQACFTVMGTTHYVREHVDFVSCSNFATDDFIEYDWDFGDGFSSSQRNPSHIYDEPGSYQVTLTVQGDYDYDNFTDVVTIEGSTDLDLLIRYLGGTDPVSNCEVMLYGSLVDWENFNNPIGDLVLNTDQNGFVYFSGLDPFTYWVDAYKYIDDFSYWSNETTDYIEVDLTADQVNSYNVYVTTVYNKKQPTRKSLAIAKIEPVTKEEREEYLKSIGIK